LCILGSSSWDKMHNIIWGTYKNAKHPMRKFQICTKSHENLPKMHKISWLTWNNAQNPMICAFFGSSSWDFVHFGKFLMGFCAYLEVPRGILCIFRSSS
jgi:hypothetical protein